MTVSQTSEAGVRASQARITARLDRLPVSRFHYKLLLICGLGFCFDAFDVGLITFIAAALNKAWALTPGQTGFLISSGFWGMLVGALLSGPLADRFGRKVLFKWTLLVFSIFSLCCAFAWNFSSLIAFRFLVGLGLGGELPVVTALLGEFVPSSGRGRIQGLLNSFWALGWVLTALVSYFIIPSFGWRWAFVAGALPAVYVWVIQRSAPESPRWLAVNGDVEKADAIVTSIEQEISKTHALPVISDEILPMYQDRKVSAKIIFSKQYLRRTIMLLALFFFDQAGYSGMFGWLPSLLVKAGHPMARSFLYVLIMQIAYIPNQILSARLADRIGRKKVIAGNFLLAMPAGLLLGYALAHGLSIVAIIVLGVALSLFQSGAWAIVVVYTPELYPTGARVTGVSFAHTCSRFGSISGPLLVGSTLGTLGVGGSFAILALAIGLAGVFVATLGVETKGLALEKINITQTNSEG